MPPKKKKRKIKQPTQRQSQKQIVNINFPEKKKRRKRRPVKKDNLQTAVQTLSSNLNMFSSDTQRLNNLENLITELRREARQPITTGKINVSTPVNLPVPPISINTPIGGGFIPVPLNTTPINPASATELEEGDPADLFRKGFDFEGGGQPIEKVKQKLKLKIKKRAEESAETLRTNVSDEFIQGGGTDTETAIPVPLKKKRKEYQTVNRKADKFYKQGLMRKVFEGMKITDNDKDRQQYENIVNKMSDMTQEDLFSADTEARLNRERTEQALKYIGDLEVAEDKTLKYV